MISKQLKIIIAFSAVIVLLLGALLLVKVLVKDEDPKEDKIELIDGEAEGSNTKPRIIEQLNEKDVAQITVHNSTGTFTFINDLKNSMTYLKDYENYPVSSEMTSSLYSRISSFLVTRIDTDPTDLSAYGLDIASDPAYLEITKFDKTVYKLYFGLRSADGSFYYMMVDGRNVVYAVNNSNIEDLILLPIESFISPLAAPILEDVSYVNIENISIKHGGNEFVSFEKVPEGYKQETGYTLTHRMTYPTNYLVSLTNFEKLLSCFANLYGTEVVGFGYYLRNDFSDLEKYGFDKDITEISYTFDELPTYLYVGGKTEDGSGYYVYTLHYDTLLIIPTESLPFVDWELGDYIGEYLFQMSIDFVKSIEVETSEKKVNFELEGTGSDLKVTANGKELGVDDEGDPMNFRQFYKNILRINWDGYSDAPEKLGKPMLNLKITTRFGEVFDYSFYQISTLRCYFVYNGSGEFYTEKATLDKFIDNFNRVVNNEPVVLEY